MEKVKTVSGREYACDYFNPCPPVGQTYVRILDATLVEVATIFANKAEIQTLEYAGVLAEGYTRLVALVPEPDAIKVILERE